MVDFTLTRGSGLNEWLRNFRVADDSEVDGDKLVCQCSYFPVWHNEGSCEARIWALLVISLL